MQVISLKFICLVCIYTKNCNSNDERECPLADELSDFLTNLDSVTIESPQRSKTDICNNISPWNTQIILFHFGFLHLLQWDCKSQTYTIGFKPQYVCNITLKIYPKRSFAYLKRNTLIEIPLRINTAPHTRYFRFISAPPIVLFTP